MNGSSIRIGRLVLILVLAIGASGVSGQHAHGDDIESRIAEFWRRIDALRPSDYVSSSDLGQWALNVIARNPRARLTAAEFRAATASMQGAIERAGDAPTSPVSSATPSPTPAQPQYTRQSPGGSGVTIPFTLEQLGFGTYGLRLTLEQTVRGVRAYEMVQGANLFNSAPRQGMEYLLAFVRIEYVTGPSPNTAYRPATYNFKAVSAAGAEYASPLCVEPTPRFSDQLYPGATSGGWVCFMINQTDAGPLMTFGRAYDGTGGVWWRLGW